MTSNVSRRSRVNNPGFAQVQGGGEPGQPDPYLGWALLSSFPTDVNNAYWTKQNVTITTGRPDWAGGTAAEAAFETTANNSHGVNIAAVLDFVLGQRYMVEGIVKSIGGRCSQMSVFSNSFGAGWGYSFDTPSGAYGSDTIAPFGGLVTSRSQRIEPLGSFYRQRLFFTAASNAADGYVFWNSQPSPISSGSFVGDTAKGMDFYSAGLYVAL